MKIRTNAGHLHSSPSQSFPSLLIYMAIIGLNNYQARVFSETYGVSEDVDLFSGCIHPGLQPLNGVHPEGDR